MKLKQYIYAGAFVAVALAAGTGAYGQSVEFLGVTNDGQRAQLKAKVDLAGKTVASVTAYSYNMTDGYTVTNTNHEFVKDGKTTYLSADVFFFAGDTEYAHRVEITFSDGTKYLSPVVTEDLGEAFMWLGDYPFTLAYSGWDGHPPVIDREIDASLTMMLDGVHYYKGISNHATGYIYYSFPTAPFTRFVTKYGVQDDRPEGNIRFFMYTSSDDFGKTPPPILQLRTEMSEPKVDQVMYAKANPANPTGPYALDAELEMNSIKSMLFYFDSNGAISGDHGHLAMARLYLPVEKKDKQTQTVTFNTPAQKITGDITLDASASSNGNIFYRIVSGRELATIQDNVLKPVWGKSGTVVVEATQYGDDTHYPATAYQTFTLDLQPKFEILGVYNPSVTSTANNNHLYLLVDSKGRKLDQLNVKVFDNVNTLVDTKNDIKLIGKYDSSKGAQVIDFVVPGGFTEQVLQVSYSYGDDATTVTMPYWHAAGTFDYISDMPTSSYKMTAGWGSPSAPNKSFRDENGGKLAIVANPKIVYAKGLGTHARGTLEIQPEVLTPYSRVAADMGAQIGYGGNETQTMAYSIESGNQVVKDSRIYDSLTETYSNGDVPKSEYVSWNVPINNGAILRLIIDKGSDNKDDNDHVCIGAPRLYYTTAEKTPQTITWKSDYRVLSNKGVTIPLDAVSSNEMPVYYYIVKGSELARIDGNNLIIDRFPAGSDSEIIVDAYQPGNDVFGSADVVSCTFSLVHGIEIQRGEFVEISGPETLDELIIHADKDSSGQFNVKKGIVDVKKIVLKYTFIPGEWNYIAFPSDLDIDKVSNLNSLGYTFNGFGVPSYTIRELNGDAYSTEEEIKEGTQWNILETPQVKGMKGYTMAIDNLLTDEPVEVTFTIDNEGVDLATGMRSLGLTLDLTGSKPDSKQDITVRAANPNVQANLLTIHVEYKPSDLSSLPVNHEIALEQMRYVFVNGHNAIRLTLPDQTPARVAIFDKTGKKLVKAVKYIAPYVIDLRDLKSGDYNMVVSYGPAVRTLPITL